mgnify:CR=1 FL=1
MISIKPEKGHLLIAEPSIFGDTTFSRSVILITEHNESGTVGFVLNKVQDVKLKELVSDFQKDWPLYAGGPVSPDQLNFIHTRPDLINDAVSIKNGLFWNGNYEDVVTAVNKGQITENEIRFFLGYSGWEQQQFDEELKQNSWIVAENTFESRLLKKADQEFWRMKMLELGGNYSLWANSPENPNLN